MKLKDLLAPYLTTAGGRGELEGGLAVQGAERFVYVITRYMTASSVLLAFS